jgi:hypothetical protein
MTTLLKLRDRGKLFGFSDRTIQKQPLRLLFLAPTLTDWLNDDLQGLVAGRGRDLSPYEQVYAIFTEYVYESGFSGVGDFVNIIPQSQGVYEMKTTDVRIFGWFYRPCQFVAVVGDLKKNLIGTNLVSTHRKTVTGFRKSFHLDKPEFVRNQHVRELLRV